MPAESTQGIVRPRAGAAIGDQPLVDVEASGAPVDHAQEMQQAGRQAVQDDTPRTGHDDQQLQPGKFYPRPR